MFNFLSWDGEGREGEKLSRASWHDSSILGFGEKSGFPPLSCCANLELGKWLWVPALDESIQLNPFTIEYCPGFPPCTQLSIYKLGEEKQFYLDCSLQ